MNVAIIDSLSRDLFDKLKEKKSDVIIFRLSGDTGLIADHPEIKFIDRSSELSGGIAFGFTEVRKKLEKIRTKYPHFFISDGCDLFEGMNKEIFWAEFDDLLISNKVAGLPAGDCNIVYDYRGAEPGKFFRKYLKAVVFLSRNVMQWIGFNGIRRNKISGLKGKIAIRINKADVISHLGNLPAALGPDNFFYFSNNKRGMAQVMPGFSIFDFSSYRHRIFLGIHFFRWWMWDDIAAALLVFEKMDQMLNSIEMYTSICSSGVKAILLNAGENEGEGNVMCALAKKFSVHSANFMNGNKAFELTNKHSAFDLWFMHDTEMQRRIIHEYGLPEETLPVTGHLLKEIAIAHSYSGTFDNILNRFKPETIVSFFASPLLQENNSLVLEFFDSYLQDHPGMIVLVKPHPREKFYLKKNTNDRIVLIENKSGTSDNNKVLFDLLKISNVAISVASTVAFQALWFGIPSLSFEVTERMRLPGLENIKVIHVRSREDLKSFFVEFLKNKADKSSYGSEKHDLNAKDSAARKMAELLLA